MNRDLGPLVCAFLIGIGALILITGIGGGRYSFTTGEWSWSVNNTPAENRIVGGIMIAFGILLYWMKPKSQ